VGDVGETPAATLWEEEVVAVDFVLHALFCLVVDHDLPFLRLQCSGFVIGSGGLLSWRRRYVHGSSEAMLMGETVVVAGCGIGGLEAALRLERKTDATVVAINPRPYTVFYPGLHGVLEDTAFEEVCINLADKFADRDIELVEDEVTGLDPEEKLLELSDSSLPFDKLVLALGSETTYHGVTRESEPNTLRFKEDVETVHERITNDAIEDVVIVGAGATGTEAAASLYTASKIEERIFRSPWSRRRTGYCRRSTSV